MSNPPTIQTNPLDPVFSGVPVTFPQTGTVNPTWNKWFVDLREKVNVINQTLATLSGGSVDPSTGALAIGSGGTGATTVVGAQTNLGILANPMTAAGDVIIGGTGGTPTRLPKSTDGYVLTLVSGVPAWAADGGGGGASWYPVANAWNTTTSNWGTLYTARIWFSGKIFFPFGAHSQRLSLFGGSSAVSVAAAYIGNTSNNGSGQPIEWVGVPTPITVGGTSAFTISPNAVVITDSISATLSASSDVCVAIAFTGSSTTPAAGTNLWGGYLRTYYVTGNDASNPVTSSYTLSSTTYCVLMQHLDII